MIKWIESNVINTNRFISWRYCGWIFHNEFAIFPMFHKHDNFNYLLNGRKQIKYQLMDKIPQCEHPGQRKNSYFAIISSQLTGRSRERNWNERLAREKNFPLYLLFVSSELELLGRRDGKGGGDGDVGVRVWEWGGGDRGGSASNQGQLSDVDQVWQLKQLLRKEGKGTAATILQFLYPAPHSTTSHLHLLGCIIGHSFATNITLFKSVPSYLNIT